MHSIRRYDWIFHIVAISLCSFFTAQIASAFLAGFFDSSPQTRTLSAYAPDLTSASPEVREPVDDLENYKIITERNIFNSTPEEKGEKGEEGDPEASELGNGELGPAVKTSLEIKVLSTLVIGEGIDHRSSAVIAGGTGGKGVKPQAYYVEEGKGSRGNEPSSRLMPGEPNKESFAPNTRLTKVAKDRIEFLNGSRLEYAEIQDFTAGSKFFASAQDVHYAKGKEKESSSSRDSSEDAGGEGSKIVLEQSQVDDALKNMDKLMSDAKIVPNFRDGQPAGMKVLSVKPGSLIAKLGIKRGDVLAKVNGQDLDIKQSMELFSQMKDLKNFSLDVVRRGKNQTIEYEIH